jgi:hypothetical protein
MQPSLSQEYNPPGNGTIATDQATFIVLLKMRVVALVAYMYMHDLSSSLCSSSYF